MPAFVVVDLVDRQTDRQSVCQSLVFAVFALFQSSKSRASLEMLIRVDLLSGRRRAVLSWLRRWSHLVGLQAREPEEERQPAAAEIHLVWRLHHGRSSRSAFP